MKYLLLTFIFATLLFSCGGKDTTEDCDSKALTLSSKAVPILLTYPEKALEYLDSAIAIDDKCFHSHYHRQIACMTLGKYEEALQSSDVILEMREGYPAFVIQRGRIYELMGDSIQAEKEFSKGLKEYKNIITEKSEWNKQLEYGESLILAGREEEGKSLIQKLKYDNPDNELLKSYIIRTRKELQEGPEGI